MLVLALAAAAGCTSRPEPIEFLTPVRCVQTKLMQVRLDAWIQALGRPIPYTVVDVGTIPTTDARTGYPTPAILRGGVDLFGMPAPTPSFPEPT